MLLTTMQLKHHKLLQGFTLVEMLVVVAIVAILAMAGFTVFGPVMKNNRDRQRLQDLNSIKQALELYRTDTHYYPATLPTSLTSPDGRKTYLKTTPKDPLSGSNWQYTYLALPNSPVPCTGLDCTSFILCAKKEGGGNNTTPSGCSALDCGNGTHCDLGVSAD